MAALRDILSSTQIQYLQEQYTKLGVSQDRLLVLLGSDIKQLGSIPNRLSILLQTPAIRQQIDDIARKQANEKPLNSPVPTEVDAAALDVIAAIDSQAIPADTTAGQIAVYAQSQGQGTLQATAQQLVETAYVTVQQKILLLNGITVPSMSGVTIQFKNGIAIITVPDGRVAKVPADDYDTLVQATVLEEQKQLNQKAAYEQWVLSNPQSGKLNTPQSINTFLQQDELDRGQGGPGLYVDPTINSPTVVRANYVVSKLTPPQDFSVLGRAFDTAATFPANGSSTPLTSAEVAKLKTPTPPNVTVTNNAQFKPTTALLRPFVPNTQAKTAGPQKLPPNNNADAPTTTQANASVLTPSGVGNSSTAPAKGDPNAYQVSPNPLDPYASYTYGIALHMLTLVEYNSIVESSGPPSPGHTLMASGGRKLNRDPRWKEEFFFDEVKIHSLIGLQETTSGTNTTEVSFTVLEPGGISLMDRLITTATELGHANHIMAPYLLQVDFFDSEEGNLQKLRKWLPIKLTNCKIRVTGKGAEYRFTGMPYLHQAMLESKLSLPANFELSGATLGDLFRRTGLGTANPLFSPLTAFREEQRRVEDARAKGGRAGTTDSNSRDATGQLGGNAGSPPVTANPTYVSISLVDAMNAWLETAASNNGQASTDFFDDIQVKFHPCFLEESGKIVNDFKYTSDGQTPMERPRNADGTRKIRATNVPEANSTKLFFTAGTQVTQIISKAVENCAFIVNQVKNYNPANKVGNKDTPNEVNKSTAQTPSRTPIVWYKIIPTLKIKNFNSVTNSYAFSITYNVVPFTSLNAKFPNAPQFSVTRADVVKEYFYLYTGLNTSVLDLQIDFDALFRTRISVYPQKTLQTSGDRQGFGTTSDTSQDPMPQNSGKPKDSGPNQNVLIYTSGDAQAAAGQTWSNQNGQLVNDLKQSLYSSTLDMVKVKLKVRGDPEFIKQDELFVTPFRGIENYNDTVANNNGSLLMDTREVLCWVEFRMPTDYSEVTSLLDRSSVSTFTGIYQVVQVVSTFKGGKFEQELDLLRKYSQDPVKDTFNERKTDVGKFLQTDTVALNSTLAQDNTFTEVTAAAKFEDDEYKKQQAAFAAENPPDPAQEALKKQFAALTLDPLATINSILQG
jgi:hypothetical protein